MGVNMRFVWLVVFGLIVFGLIPLLIEATGRWDLYYTLTSVALLSIASAGVWLTFAYFLSCVSLPTSIGFGLINKPPYLH